MSSSGPPPPDLSARLAALEPERLERHELAHRRSALFARLLPADELPPGERYEVDLSVPRFDYFIEHRQTTWADVQLVGTYLPGSSSFRWGFENESIAPAGYERLARVVRESRWAPLAAVRGFELEFERLRWMADAIARDAGFLATYPAPVGEAVALLALRLRLSPDYEFDSADNVWCSLCGRPRTAVRALLRGAHGHLCDVCVEELSEVASEPPSVELESSCHEAMPPCLMSGEYWPRVFGRESAVSYSVLQQARGILRELPR